MRRPITAEERKEYTYTVNINLAIDTCNDVLNVPVEFYYKAVDEDVVNALFPAVLKIKLELAKLDALGYTSENMKEAKRLTRRLYEYKGSLAYDSLWDEQREQFIQACGKFNQTMNEKEFTVDDEDSLVSDWMEVVKLYQSLPPHIKYETHLQCAFEFTKQKYNLMFGWEEVINA